MTGGSTSAGVLATALAFGLVLLALAYTLGPASGCHINPAVTRGILRSGRMAIGEALGYLGHSVGEPAEKEPARGDGPAPYCGEEVLL